MEKFENLDLMDKFLSYTEKMKQKLLYLRQLIFEVANLYPEIGHIKESF